MSYELKRANPEEISAIGEIYNQATSHAHTVGTIDWPQPFPTEYLREYQKAGELFCLRGEQEHPVAAIRISTVPNIKIWPDNDTPALYVGKAAVGLVARSQNVAENIILPNLITMAQEQNLQELRLDCLAKNIRLKKFYEKAFINRGDVTIDSAFGGVIHLTRYSKEVSRTGRIRGDDEAL